ncbi:uncharacterized protein LOC111705091 [Eurytemora carolleeae]|uniref:uncharacterized protein LOC111705091 n=1 Tax=Eurytemora carolleeae TaxID=1294199 RepID=UPI000C7712F6|nr:uncharacterized protein LOC111705091 [Eurytemora carolleeae]|eukprot:XP_023333304.1 uncharacterized protein LOC111705091 [Eurytemora affinis]
MIPPEQEKRSLFDSPFKRFTQFTGIPSMNRFPLQQVPTNRFQRRLPPSRIPYRPGTSRRGSSSQDKPLVSPRFLRQPPSRLSDNKVGFYQAGDRFGQKTQLEEGFKDDGKEDGGRIKSNCSSPILEKKVLDEPDLLQGQMQRLKL